MKSVCAQRGYTYLDYHSALVDKSGQLTADLADDGLHPNSKGYRIIPPIALEAIDHTAKASKPQQEQRKKRLGVF